VAEVDSRHAELALHMENVAHSLWLLILTANVSGMNYSTVAGDIRAGLATMAEALAAIEADPRRN
jgi:hypothetical protein